MCYKMSCSLKLRVRPWAYVRHRHLSSARRALGTCQANEDRSISREQQHWISPSPLKYSVDDSRSTNTALAFAVDNRSSETHRFPEFRLLPESTGNMVHEEKEWSGTASLAFCHHNIKSKHLQPEKTNTCVLQERQSNSKSNAH